MTIFSAPHAMHIAIMSAPCTPKIDGELSHETREEYIPKMSRHTHTHTRKSFCLDNFPAVTLRVVYVRHWGRQQRGSSCHRQIWIYLVSYAAHRWCTFYDDIHVIFSGFGGCSVCQTFIRNPHIHVFAFRFVWKRNILFNFDLMFLVLSSSSSSLFIIIICILCVDVRYARDGIILRHGRSFSSACLRAVDVFAQCSQYHIPYSSTDHPIERRRQRRQRYEKGKHWQKWDMLGMSGDSAQRQRCRRRVLTAECIFDEKRLHVCEIAASGDTTFNAISHFLLCAFWNSGERERPPAATRWK